MLRQKHLRLRHQSYIKKNIKDKVNNMEDWELTIEFHWPNDRFALGWEHMDPDETFEYSTSKLYLLFITITLDY